MGKTPQPEWLKDPEPGDYFERWRLDKVMKVTGFGHSAIYKRIGEGTFPRQRRDRNGRDVYWISTQVIAWNHEELSLDTSQPVEIIPPPLHDHPAGRQI